MENNEEKVKLKDRLAGFYKNLIGKRTAGPDVFYKSVKDKFSGKFAVFGNKLDTLFEITGPFNEAAEERLAGFSRRRLFFRISFAFVFLFIYVMLFLCFPPTELFKNTTTNGGDMGAHNYAAKFFIDNLLPSFRMSGWDMGWFAGMPMLTFYFPLPFLLIALLSKLVVYNVAFKLVTVLGSLMLPAALYFFGRMLRFKYPFPQFAAVGAMAFLYMKSFSIYGGNFLGTFAGEFSYSISFALVIFFLATLYRGSENGKFDWLFAINCILLGGIVISHLITLIAVIVIAPSLFLINRSWKCARYIIVVFIIGFFLSAFWSLPFVMLVKWTPTMSWTNIKDLKSLFPLEIIPALVLGAIGLFFSTIKKDKRVVPITWTVIVFMSVFFTWNGGRLYNARFLPFIFLFIYLLAAYGISHLYWLFVTVFPLIRKRRVKKDGAGEIFEPCSIQESCHESDQNMAFKAVPDFTVDLQIEVPQKSLAEKTNIPGPEDTPKLEDVTVPENMPGPEDITVPEDITEIKTRADFRPGLWMRLKEKMVGEIPEANFTKFRKGFYKFIVIAFVPIIAVIAGAGIWAGNPLGPAWARHNFTGFEEKPDWKTYDDVMKYLDSLPYGRVMFEFNKEIIQKYGTPRSFELIPFWTKQPGMEGLLVESSLTAPWHYMNQAELSLKPRGTVAGWSVPGRNYEAAIKHLQYMNITYIMACTEEVIADLDSDPRVEFLNKIDPWYFYEMKGDHNYVEIMDNAPYRYKTDDWINDMRDWYKSADNVDNPVIYDDGSINMADFISINKESLKNVPENPVVTKGEITYEKVEREKIEFYTTGIGQPHLVKVSYFPNWKVTGAEGPYLVSPSLMLVYPTQNEVTLYYGMTPANRIGVTLSVSGWVVIVLVLVVNLVFYLKSKRAKKRCDK